MAGPAYLNWYLEVAKRGNDRVTFLKETNFPCSSAEKDWPAMQEIQKSWVRSPHQEDPLEEVIDKKKWCTTWELQVEFYLGQNEDCSPRGSISHSSERLLQSGSGRKTVYKVWWRGSCIPWSTHFSKDFLYDTMRIWRLPWWLRR